MNIKTLFLASLLVTLPAAANAQSQSQTLIFGGTIYSGDPANPHPEAVGIEGKKIVAVGSYQEVSARLGNHAKRLDLKGKVPDAGAHRQPCSYGICRFSGDDG